MTGPHGAARRPQGAGQELQPLLLRKLPTGKEPPEGSFMHYCSASPVDQLRSELKTLRSVCTRLDLWGENRTQEGSQPEIETSALEADDCIRAAGALWTETSARRGDGVIN